MWYGRVTRDEMYTFFWLYLYGNKRVTYQHLIIFNTDLDIFPELYGNVLDRMVKLVEEEFRKNTA